MLEALLLLAGLFFFDIFKKGKTTYHVDRTLRETKDVVDNGLYEVYVNTKIDDSSSTAALMKVFKSTKPVQDERFQRVCEKLREYKEGKGRNTMCKLVEDYACGRGSTKGGKGNSSQGICNGTADRKCRTAGKAFDEGIGKDCG